MAQVTHVEVGYVRQTQPAQYEKAEPSIKFVAKLDEDGENHLKVASGLLIDAQVLAHAALGSPLPEKIKNAWVNSGIVKSFLPAYEPVAKPAPAPIANTLPAALQAQVEREADKPATPAVPAATETKVEAAPATPKRSPGRPKMTEEQKKAAAEARQKTQAQTDPSFIPVSEPAAAPKPTVDTAIPGDAPATIVENKVAVVTPAPEETKVISFDTIQAFIQNMAKGKVPFNTITEIIAAHGGGSKLLADVPPAKYAEVMAAIKAVAKE